MGARIKSEADMEEIMDNLQEQALEDKKMRSYAVIPPILLDVKERKLTYQNTNGHMADMSAVYKSRQFLNIWTPSEKDVFREKYLQHPKNFIMISSYLERKSVADCVQYYYLSKKTENYKQLLRKSRRTRSSRNNMQKVNSSANASTVDILTTGVTTRLQREQQQKTVGQQNRDQTNEQPTPVSTSPIQATIGIAPSTITSTTTLTTTPNNNSTATGTTTMAVISSTGTATVITTTTTTAPSTINNSIKSPKTEPDKSDCDDYRAKTGSDDGKSDGNVNGSLDNQNPKKEEENTDSPARYLFTKKQNVQNPFGFCLFCFEIQIGFICFSSFNCL